MNTTDWADLALWGCAVCSLTAVLLIAAFRASPVPWAARTFYQAALAAVFLRGALSRSAVDAAENEWLRLVVLTAFFAASLVLVGVLIRQVDAAEQERRRAKARR